MTQSRLSPASLLLWLALCVVAQCSVALFGVASRWLQVRWGLLELGAAVVTARHGHSMGQDMGCATA